MPVAHLHPPCGRELMLLNRLQVILLVLLFFHHRPYTLPFLAVRRVVPGFCVRCNFQVPRLRSHAHERLVTPPIAIVLILPLALLHERVRGNCSHCNYQVPTVVRRTKLRVRHGAAS